MAPRLRIEGKRFRDKEDREIILHGINVAGDAKLPAHPDLPSHERDSFFDGYDISFVGRPFPLDEAHIHFSRLRRWGYNTIRYVFTWEAIEACGPGDYDEDWVQFTISVLRVAKEYGFYIFMDPHQDVWSRFSGGSGAPMWTLYACGLDPEAFAATEAALVQNTWPDPQDFPKMIWATNYSRLVCQVMFTLFFAGKDFAPKAIINGVNIQDFLQNHFIAAVAHLARRIQEAADLDQDVVVGWESLNEPNKGLIGVQDITVVPSEQKLQLGTSPSAWQAILLGSGRSCEVETWAFGSLGPYKSGSKFIDPGSRSAWVQTNSYDARYGFNRDANWKLGQCIWAQHGVWDPSSETLFKSDYFAKNPRTGDVIDYEYFTNTYFVTYYRKHRSAIREIFPHTIMFCQPPVNELPPTLKDPEDFDPNMVFAPHWYDGLTLMTKKWNRLWNIDVFGVLRGKYLTPAFAIKVGETAIRNCFRDTLKAMNKEGMDNMGERPCVFTEIGIPYDMDDKNAYKTGDFSSQILAMDANHYAIEASKSHFTWWTYVATNCHKWGDQWDGEDLSIVSTDDVPLPSFDSPLTALSTTTLSRNSPSYSASQISEATSVTPLTLNSAMTAERIVPVPSSTFVDDKIISFRAAEAYVRPTPIVVHGDVISFGFDLRNCIFSLTLTAASSTQEDCPTEIYLPQFHFPAGSVEVDLSGGKSKVVLEEHDRAPQQRLRWWHAAGEQSIRVTGLKKRQSLFHEKEDEAGYLECVQRGCDIM